MKLPRFLAAITAASLLVTLVPQIAVAASPHFIGDPTCSKSLNSGLTCSGKAAGLANVTTGAFLTASSASINFQCQNKGQNFAPGHPAVTNSIVGPTEQISPHNGSITFSPTLPIPPVAASGNCPNSNWKVVVLSVTYFDVVLHIQQGGADLLTFDFGTVDP
jgi:hypothetical protein